MRLPISFQKTKKACGNVSVGPESDGPELANRPDTQAVKVVANHIPQSTSEQHGSHV
jgi:hypothetical protein